MADQGPIYFFKEDDVQWGFLCQWYKRSFVIEEKGREFMGKNGVRFATEPGQAFVTAEQFMMWHKAMAFSDPKTAAEILHQGNSPRKCKALGAKVQDFDSETWDRIKLAVVEEASYLKFTCGLGDPGKELRRCFLETAERELVEASPIDRVWGVGFRKEQLGGKNGVKRDCWGENRLGRALMVARDRIKREEEEAERSARIRAEKIARAEVDEE